ncbi:MAG: Tetratricopeptide repeat protein [Myxococcales bacterium]|nr:Tetratricopeptide repeat protein [Myxococcales bacterium]
MTSNRGRERSEVGGRILGWLLIALVLASALTTIAIPRRAIAAVEDDLRDGDKYFEDGDWKKAAGAFDRAIAKAPGQVSAEAYGKRAAIFIILKDLKAGLEFVAKAKPRFPNAPEILEQEALMLWETEKRDEAVKVAEKVVAARPQTFSNQKILGEYYAGRDAVKTVAAFEGYLAGRPAELESGDVLPRIRLGFAYLANARSVLADGDDARAQQLYQRAADQFDVVIRKFGKKPNAQVNADNGLCAAYSGLGRWDQAVTVCERIIQDTKRIDATGSVWFNLGTAYLARKQPKKARSAGNEFTRLRKNEARGYILIGDSYFADNDWGNALEQYQRGEKLLKPNQARELIQLSIRLGKTYRRLPAPASGPNPNLNLAIEKLASALGSNPSSLELAAELGSAYLAAKQDSKATALTDRMLAGSEIAKAPPEQRAAILVIAGKSLFNQHKLKEARQRFEAAQQLRAGDVQIKRELVETINEQAFDLAKDTKAAQALLEQALAIDASSPATLTNIAILSIERGECEPAQKQLVRLKDLRGSDAVVTARLLARTYLCQSRPEPKKAIEAYAAAEKEAKKANAQLALAEIYTEWAPLVWDANLEDAIDKLELAVQIGSQDPDIGPAAKRNLSLALYRRGWKLMRDGKSVEAAADFERADRDPSVQRGTEGFALDFSYAVALLDANRPADAAKAFKSLAAKGNQGAYLKGAYAKVGSQFLGAYASYRTGAGPARQQACADFAKLEPEIGGKARELLASCWEMVAVEQFRAGQPGAALKSLATADKYAAGDTKRRLDMDRAVISLGKDKAAQLEGLGGNPPESLVNLGLVYDMAGKPKEAYDAWQRAKARGVNARDLQKWIDAKRRIYGY